MSFMMNGTPTLYVDQYGNIFWTKTIKDNQRQSKTFVQMHPETNLTTDPMPFSNPATAEDLESASPIARDSSDSNFLGDRLSAVFRNCIARVALFAALLEKAWVSAGFYRAAVVARRLIVPEGLVRVGLPSCSPSGTRKTNRD